MGQQDVTPRVDPEETRIFTRYLLRDLESLEAMVRDGMIEGDVRRIGAEQEVFLVDRHWRATASCVEILDRLQRPEMTTELAQFNLEVNLPPHPLAGECFHDLHAGLDALLADVRDAARDIGANVVLTGILPTLTKSDLSLHNLTPRDRYYVLNDAVNRMRGEPYRVHIQGVDELNLEHDTVMLEACNTSFQAHLQVAPSEFAHLYNIAQAVTAPLLAAAVNSPLLFGRRLWSETRIALFQQSVDTRRATPYLRELTPRVRFGERWVTDGVTEVFQEDIARIPVLIRSPTMEDSRAVLASGGVPKLAALQLYNGTVYRWNRPCYGVHDGKPHLRIECRVLPSGPSTVDEVANMALWVGAVLGLASRYEDITSALHFDDARANLVAAARRGLDAGFTWLDGRPVSARTLVRDELVPIAEEGLRAEGVAERDIQRYLGVIVDRVASGTTGSRWLQESLVAMSGSGTTSERMGALTAATWKRQQSGAPCHEWPLARIGDGGGWRRNYQRVEQYMTTDLFTVREDELVDLAAFIMEWKGIRQVPVEDHERRLLGMVSYGAVLRYLASCCGTDNGARAVPVRDIMLSDPVTVSPDTATREAIRLMREHRVTYLPVVLDDKLIGIVTMDDFLPMAERLIEEITEDDVEDG